MSQMNDDTVEEYYQWMQEEGYKYDREHQFEVLVGTLWAHVDNIIRGNTNPPTKWTVDIPFVFHPNPLQEEDIPITLVWGGHDHCDGNVGVFDPEENHIGNVPLPETEENQWGDVVVEDGAVDDFANDVMGEVADYFLEEQLDSFQERRANDDLDPGDSVLLPNGHGKLEWTDEESVEVYDPEYNHALTVHPDEVSVGLLEEVRTQYMEQLRRKYEGTPMEEHFAN